MSNHNQINSTQPMDVESQDTEIQQLVDSLAGTSIEDIITMNRDYSNVVVNISEQRLNYTTGNTEYKVHWHSGDWTWEPDSNISTHTLKINEFKNNHNHLVSHNVSSGQGNYTNKSAFIYTRTSSPNDISIASQRERCQKYCLKNNIKISYYAEDIGVSGRYNKGKQLMNNLSQELGFWLPILTQNIILVVSNVDRIGRHSTSVLTLLDKLVSRGIDIHFVEEDITWNSEIKSHQKMVIQQQVLQSEQFSDLTSEKVKRSIAERKSNGHFIGNPKFGFRAYRSNGIRKFKRDVREYQIVKEILKKYYSYINTPVSTTADNQMKFPTKAYLFRRICKEVNRSGYRYRKNKLFRPSNISTIIKNNKP